VYEKLQAKIEREGRAAWIAEEMTKIAEIGQYQPDPQNAWTRLKARTRDVQVLQLLRAAAAWREEQAARKNVPRQRILKDDWVVQVATQKPKTPEEMLEVRGIQGQLGKEMMASLLEALNAAATQPADSFPPSPERVKPLPAAQEACLDQLRLLLRQRCEDMHLVPRLVVGKDDLEHLVRGSVSFEHSPISHGWRYEVFGAAAKDLLSGKMSAHVVPHRGGYGLVWQQASPV
jgi:ribonuclease D